MDEVIFSVPEEEEIDIVLEEPYYPHIAFKEIEEYIKKHKIVTRDELLFFARKQYKEISLRKLREILRHLLSLDKIGRIEMAHPVNNGLKQRKTTFYYSKNLTEEETEFFLQEKIRKLSEQKNNLR